MRELYDKYKDRGFMILAFPCDNFGNQEPGMNTAEEIATFADEHKVDFPIFSKVDVNGRNVADLFKFLKSSCPGIFYTTSVKWNFTKFLIKRDGVPHKRYSPTTSPLALSGDIKNVEEESDSEGGSSKK